MSVALLQELHLLTRDGQLNQDARRKLKQIRHFVGLLQPNLDDLYARTLAADAPVIVDCGAGKSYLGFLLYELVVGPRGRGQLYSLEVRRELQAAAAARAARFGHERFHFATGAIGEGEAALPERLHMVTALHACDTATDDAIALGIRRQADFIAVVPCCQAEVARQLKDGERDGGGAIDSVTRSLFRHPLHRRELGSHLTNVVRGLAMQAHGYQVTVTELVGWEHSAKNELLLAKRVARFDRRAADELRQLCERFAIAPQLVSDLATSAAAPPAGGAPAESDSTN